MQIIPNFDLSSFNTLAVPSICSHYCEVESEDELKLALSWALDRNLPACILGGGSNVLLDPHLNALVIRMLLKGFYVEDIVGSVDDVYITVAAGESWHEFVMSSLENRWYGLENLALIPGSVGAAPIQNIGAYGVEIKDRFHKLTALNVRTGVVEIFNKSDCQFGYRESFFKKANNNYVILNVTFILSLNDTPNVNYPALKSEANRMLQLKEKSSGGNTSYLGVITANTVADAVISLRTSKLPDPHTLPNAGSFFKNPIVSKDRYFDLLREFPELVAYDDAGGKMKLAAAWLIDCLGWKGRSYNRVTVHDAQALVLTNPNRCPLANVLALAKHIQDDVHSRFGVVLEIEPQRLVGQI